LLLHLIGVLASFPILVEGLEVEHRGPDIVGPGANRVMEPLLLRFSRPLRPASRCSLDDA